MHDQNNSGFGGMMRLVASMTMVRGIVTHERRSFTRDEIGTEYRKNLDENTTKILKCSDAVFVGCKTPSDALNWIAEFLKHAPCCNRDLFLEDDELLRIQVEYLTAALRAVALGPTEMDMEVVKKRAHAFINESARENYENFMDTLRELPDHAFEYHGPRAN